MHSGREGATKVGATWKYRESTNFDVFAKCAAKRRSANNDMICGDQPDCTNLRISDYSNFARYTSDIDREGASRRKLTTKYHEDKYRACHAPLIHDALTSISQWLLLHHFLTMPCLRTLWRNAYRSLSKIDSATQNRAQATYRFRALPRNCAISATRLASTPSFGRQLSVLIAASVCDLMSVNQMYH